MKAFIYSIPLFVSVLGFSEPSIAAKEKLAVQPVQIENEYKVRDYSYLLGMRGFTDSLLKMHFQLYAGYVHTTNMLVRRLQEWGLQDKSKEYEYTALKRRLGWEWDGMRLHELYFENLGGNGQFEKKGALYERMHKDFGSFEHWKMDFVDTALTRGIGWVILYRDPVTGRLFNTWIDEHDVGHLAGGDPLLVIDVWEHAYITEFGLDRGKYIDIFFENLDWSAVTRRFGQSAAI